MSFLNKTLLALTFCVLPFAQIFLAEKDSLPGEALMPGAEPSYLALITVVVILSAIITAVSLVAFLIETENSRQPWL